MKELGRSGSVFWLRVCGDNNINSVINRSIGGMDQTWRGESSGVGVLRHEDDEWDFEWTEVSCISSMFCLLFLSYSPGWLPVHCVARYYTELLILTASAS